jgi:helix-turn-helix protein
VTVGEALADARTRAGLTVDEVSERTRIREKIIRDIERDDYEACGGDLFARGYVRVIAGAVGVDAQPLIREYDQSRQRRVATVISPEPAPEPDAPEPDSPEPDFPELDSPEPDSPELDAPEPETEADSPEPESEPGTPSAETGTSADEPPAGTTPGYDLVPLRIQPGPRLHPSLTRYTWRSRFRDRRREVVAAVLAIAVLAVVAIAAVHIVSSLSRGSGASMTAGSGAAHQAPAPRAVAANADPAGAEGAKDPAPARRKHAKAPRLVPVRQLPVPLAEAFGPDGPADGDNPGNAMNAVRPSAAGPWTTQWYATATFGQLKPGTGLLLDMGATVTVTRAAINLGAGSGADLQLRAGSEAGNLHTVTSAASVGGDVVLHLREPVRARYLLVWFTLLPSADNGQYQASVYHVTIDGRP